MQGLKRHELIFALSKWVHQTMFEKVLSMSDAGLIALLAYYESGGTVCIS